MTAIAAPRLPPRLPAALGLALLVAIVVVLVLAPLVMILLRAVFDSAGGTWVPTGRHIVTVLTGAIYWQALASTVAVAAAAAALATLLGTALAWIFVRTTTFGRARAGADRADADLHPALRRRGRLGAAARPARRRDEPHLRRARYCRSSSTSIPMQAWPG